MAYLNPFKLHRLVTLLLASAILLSSSANAQNTAAGQSLFLKEILTGRCYEKMTTTANQCPQVVGSIMSVLDSQMDANIDAVSSFAPYLRQVDMSSPNNQALIWLTGNDGSFVGNSYQTSNNNVGGYSGYGGYSNNNNRQRQGSSFALHREMAPIELVTPEQTPGGFLMQDLVFCGVDQKSGCTKVNSNAYSSFWAAAYSQFARTASGRVQIVIEPFADLNFLRTNVIQQLNAYQVTEVILYVENCQDQAYAQLTDTFPITSVQCKDQFSDYAFFLLCQNPSSDACSMLSEVDTTGTISTYQEAAIEQQEEDELLEKKNSSGGGSFFFKFILFGIACTLVYRYMQKPRGPPQYYQYDNVPPAETTTMRI
mmetsp:Transcript_13736/g.33271  ORF Transcript_13736/g.33271 Transcript_13736/m.33271 type:complete len:369 (+) Transcript_13736:124-1230(+)